MKKTLLNLMAAGAAGWLISASAQPAPDANGGNNPPPPATEPTSPPAGAEATPPPPPTEVPPPVGVIPPDSNTPPTVALTEVVPSSANTVNTTAPASTNAATEPAVILSATKSPMPAVNVVSSFVPPAEAHGSNNPDELRLNFRNAPLEMVLNYLSDAAGFIIVLDTPVNGSVSVISNRPMTRDEAVDLLNFELNKNGYAAIRNGRTLTIVDKSAAKTRDIPVKTGNNPDEIPKNAEIVTQIIPIRFVEARQLVSDLTSFVSPQATVVANEGGNSIVITDTQSNIRHLAEIIKAVDDSAEAETEIRVFRLKHASPTDVATELASIFPSSSSGTGTQSPISFRGGGGGGGFLSRIMGATAGGAAPGNSSNDRIKKATQVNVVPDSRIQAVIVTAPKDLMLQIANMMNDLDVPSTRDQKVYVFHMNNGDPQQAALVLQNMFQSSGTSRSGGSSSSQNSALMQRAQNNTTSTSSTKSSGTSSTGSGGRAGSATQF